MIVTGMSMTASKGTPNYQAACEIALDSKGAIPSFWMSSAFGLRIQNNGELFMGYKAHANRVPDAPRNHRLIDLKIGNPITAIQLVLDGTGDQLTYALRIHYDARAGLSHVDTNRDGWVDATDNYSQNDVRTQALSGKLSKADTKAFKDAWFADKAKARDAGAAAVGITVRRQNNVKTEKAVLNIDRVSVTTTTTSGSSTKPQAEVTQPTQKKEING